VMNPGKGKSGQTGPPWKRTRAGEQPVLPPGLQKKKQKQSPNP
jgi:hypothetical protein